MGEYGNVVTYSYNGTVKPAYTTTNKRSGNVQTVHSKGFQWYDENGVYHKITSADLRNEENNGKEIAKIKSTVYRYEIDLEQGTNLYNMLSYTNSYWLASTYTYTEIVGVFWGMLQVANDVNTGTSNVHSSNFVYSKGDFVTYSAGIRAVVRLSAEYNP